MSLRGLIVQHVGGEEATCREVGMGVKKSENTEGR